MLLAEIHGKGTAEARDHEDYLTSTVFSHLRYLPPSIFWEDLFRQTRGLPNEDGVELSLAKAVSLCGCAPCRYSEVKAFFWPNHPYLGEPDLLLLFSGTRLIPLIVLVEAKLWSEKGGVG